MKSPSHSLYKETLSGGLQVPVKKLTPRMRFSMIPEDVLRNPDLSMISKFLLGVMAYISRGCEIVTASHSVMATLCCVSRPSIINSLKQLVKEKHIEKSGEPVNQVQSYRILHPRLLWSRKEKEEAAAVRQTSVAVEEQRLPRCYVCKLPRKRVNIAGICRTCVDASELQRKIDSARVLLGATASAKEIAVHLKHAKFSAKVQKLIDKPA